MPPFDMPCLQPDGLSVFTQTPEQRLLLGEDWFNATHIPMGLRRFVRDKPQVVTEDDLFAQLQDTQRYVGNRVIALYGAAGSGKSELMTWMERRFAHFDPKRPIVRISRTELDVLSIINRMKHLLTGDYFSDATVQRWEEMRRKPRTLSKLLVLHALERLLDSDDLINALFYRLIDIVEPQVKQVLERVAGREALDIVMRDDFEAVRIDTAVALPFEFEVFRQHLLDGFREMMLENMSIRETLSALSNHFTQQQQRPILLIDDLVQSINLFATEFLDWFTTLDQGNWDVLIGITPASFQHDARGRELLDRLNHLDTFDDRVEKLWLSDEQGFESYFLTEASCTALAFSYLQSFRRFNRVECVQCPALVRCQALQRDDAYLLAPFTETALLRLFRSLPATKGKVRAFITTLRFVLEALMDGETIADTFASVAKTELFVESDVAASDDLLKWYAKGSAHPVGHILDFFSVPHPLSLAMTSLDKAFLPESTNAHVESQDDETQFAVRDWLEGKEVNRQMLQKLRKGISFWLRNVQTAVALGSLHHPRVARPHRILRDARVEMDSVPPIVLQDIDQFEGIEVSRTIGHLAFLFVQVSEAGGRVQSQVDRELAQDPRTLRLIWQAERYMEERRQYLENQIGIPLDEFALLVYALRLLLNGSPKHTVSEVWTRLSNSLPALHEHLRYFIAPLPSHLVKSIDKLFDDFFKLRDNLYDIPRILHLLQNLTAEMLLHRLYQIPWENIDEVFYLGNLPLRAVVERLQVQIRETLNAFHNASPSAVMRLSPTDREVLGRLQQGDNIPLGAIPVTSWQDFHDKTPDFYRRMHVVMRRESD